MAVISYMHGTNGSVKFLDNKNHIVAIRQNISQKAFADQIGTTREQIKMAEKGHFIEDHVFNAYTQIGTDLGHIFNKK